MLRLSKAPDITSADSALYSSVPFGHVPANGMYALNNTYGRGSLVNGVDYTCKITAHADIFPKATTMEWSFPDAGNGSGFAYAWPLIHYGDGYFGNPYNAVGPWPIQVDNVTNLTISYDLTIGGNINAFDMLIDLFITASPTSTDGSYAYEISIYPYSNPGVFPTGGTVHLLSTGYWYFTKVFGQELQAFPVNSAGTAFRNLLVSTIDIKEILTTMKTLGWIAGQEYVRGIDFGPEIQVPGTFNGFSLPHQGFVTFNALAINWNDSIVPQNTFKFPWVATGPWKKAIPAGAVYQQAPLINSLVPNISSWEVTRSSFPIYRATASDPIVNVYYNVNTSTKLYNSSWAGSGNSGATETTILAGSSATFPFDSNTYSATTHNGSSKPALYNALTNPPSGPKQIRCPRGVIPERGADSHLIVYQPDGTYIEMYGAIILSSGDIVCLYYMTGDPALAGDAWQNGTTASMIPALAGLIKQADLDVGFINHAIHVTLPASALAYDVLYPAATFDRNTVYSGIYPMGARFALPASLDINTLGLSTPQGLILANALQMFGAIVTDSNGGGIVFKAEEGITDSGFTSFSGTINTDLTAICSMLQFVQIPVQNFTTNPPVITNAAPTGLTVTWRSGFSGGLIPPATTTGTVIADLSSSDSANDPITFVEIADPDSKFTVSGSTLILSATIAAGETHYLSIAAKGPSNNKFVGTVAGVAKSPIIVDTFESGAINAYWGTSAGSSDSTNFKNGLKSWRVTNGNQINKTVSNATWAEWDAYVRVDVGSTATSGNFCRLMQFEGSKWNGANGLCVGIDKNGSNFRLGLARGGGALTSAGKYALATNTWVLVRFAVQSNGGAGNDRADMWVDGTLIASLTGLTLNGAANSSAWGAYAYNPGGFLINFDDLTRWDMNSA